MRTLIALTSCHAHRPWQQAQRDTWLKDLPADVDYRFFLGRPKLLVPDEDEVLLDVPDDYNQLKYKTQALMQWSYSHLYDFTFKTDVDTLVIPRNLLSCCFEKQDYMGGMYRSMNTLFASGGAGYWVSRVAMGLIASERPEPGPEEDVHVARTLFKHHIFLRNSSRFKFIPGSELDDRTATYHLSSVPGWKTPYSPDMMYSAYQRYKEISANHSHPSGSAGNDYSPASGTRS